MSISAVAAGVAGGCDSEVLQAVGQGLEAHDQILNNGAIVLGEARKHTQTHVTRR